jgi:hypothetical protein
MPQNRQDVAQCTYSRKFFSIDPTNKPRKRSWITNCTKMDTTSTRRSSRNTVNNLIWAIYGFWYYHDLHFFPSRIFGMQWTNAAGYIFSQLGGAFVVHYPRHGFNVTYGMEPRAKGNFNTKVRMEKCTSIVPEMWKVQVDGLQRGRVDAAFVDPGNGYDQISKTRLEFWYCHWGSDAKLWMNGPRWWR